MEWMIEDATIPLASFGAFGHKFVFTLFELYLGLYDNYGFRLFTIVVHSKEQYYKYTGSLLGLSLDTTGSITVRIQFLFHRIIISKLQKHNPFTFFYEPGSLFCKR
jgi:hypothetical protein